jgi:hypothetical protein
MSSPAHLPELKTRHALEDTQPTVFTDIYQEEVNIAVWQRELPSTLTLAVAEFLQQKPTFKASLTVTPSSVRDSLAETFGSSALEALTDDIAELVDMFCCIFELKRAGLRLTALDKAMCPKFHVDRVPTRLVTTYYGIATQYIPHHLVNRAMLGHGSGGKPDHKSGLFDDEQAIRQMRAGDVALLKGESWLGNEGAGLVHRSPAVPAGEHRMLMTLDFSD